MSAMWAGYDQALKAPQFEGCKIFRIPVFWIRKFVNNSYLLVWFSFHGSIKKYL